MQPQGQLRTGNCLREAENLNLTFTARTLYTLHSVSLQWLWTCRMNPSWLSYVQNKNPVNNLCRHTSGQIYIISQVESRSTIWAKLLAKHSLRPYTHKSLHPVFLLIFSWKSWMEEPTQTWWKGSDSEGKLRRPKHHCAARCYVYTHFIVKVQTFHNQLASTVVKELKALWLLTRLLWQKQMSWWSLV